MISILKFELSRAFKSRSFLIPLGLFILYMIYNIIFEVIPTAQEAYMTIDTITPTYLWLTVNETGILRTVFFFTPLLVVLPFSWSYALDTNLNYTCFLYARAKKQHYLLAKFIATFLTGGILFVLPLLLHYIILTCLFPNWPVHYGTFQIVNGSLMIDLIYSNPILYVLFYCLINFLYAGFLAVIGLSAGLFTSKKYIVCLVPFFIWIIISAICEFSGLNNWSPERFLRPSGEKNASLFFIISFWISMMYIPLTLFLKMGKKHELN
ncbi:hypothetical protein [Bacillus pseudomycoides]|uniref:hypothetical protein n=1 Tax=Bacillus pseudomycoides TaxID=64104 RepID=UPI000BFE109A|nr:hypothetical protein [Bacillus pseudomycoides]PGR97626.1 hypothetical protein COC54_24585 [Bacillus pseudomycoides]